MEIQLKNCKSWNWPLISLLLLAAGIRFWNFFQIPYHHDELSALHRTFFSNFSDLIEKGVQTTDTHPPLVQVWLYYYTKIFGYEEWIVKLPFLIVSLVGLYCMYRLTKRWTNNTVALIILAIFAVSHYHLLHSQMIRMYIPGFFFTLQFIYYWSEMVLFKQETKKNFVLFIVYGILGALTHHFCLLALLLTALIGLFLVQKSFRWKYIALCLLIPLLYLPNIGVFLTQLKMGGIGGSDGWLAEPTTIFLWNYIQYLFNFSFVLIGIVLSFLFISRFFKTDSEAPKEKLRVAGISTFLFLSSFFIGYFYSVYKNPVLQYSVLLFVSPFLFIGILSIIQNQKHVFNWIAIALISISGTYSLVQKTNYFNLFFTSGFSQSITDCDLAKKENKNTFCIIGLDYSKTLFYKRTNKLNISNEYYFLKAGNLVSPLEFEHLIRSVSKKHQRIHFSSAASIPKNYRGIIQCYFPKLISQKNYYLFTSTTFEKGQTNSKLISTIFHSNKWQNLLNTRRTKKRIVVSEGIEWGPSFEVNLSTYQHKIQDEIQVNGKFKLSNFSQDLALVGSIMKADSLIFYTCEELKNRVVNQEDSSVCFSVFVPLNLLHSKEKMVFNTYLWNRSKQKVLIEQFEVRKVKGNPVIYGLMEPKIN